MTEIKTLSQPDAPEALPPINWVTTLMFALTTLGAVVLVPWYGLAHGFKLASFGVGFFFLIACGMCVTAGYHRLWAHRAYDAHPLVKVIYLIFGSMALQNSALVWCSGHRVHHLHVDDNERDPYSAGRGFWFSHIGWMLRYYPSGNPDFANVRDLERDPLLAFQHRYYIPIALAANFGLTFGAGLIIGDVWGTFILAGLLRVVLCASLHLLHQLVRAHVGRAPVLGSEQRARQPGAGVPHLRRGLSQLPPQLRARLPQRRALVAVGSDQVDGRGAALCRPRAAPAAHACVPDTAGVARDAVPARAGEACARALA